MSARPFQVGDRVKITDRDPITGKTIRIHIGTVRSIKDMSSSEPGVGDWATLFADVEEPYRMGNGDQEHTSAIVHLTTDHTRTTWAKSETIELLPPDATPDRTHILDRIPGEPNPLDPEPVYGFDAGFKDEDGHWYARPTLWITAEQFRDLGEPQQITVTIAAVTR